MDEIEFQIQRAAAALVAIHNRQSPNYPIVKSAAVMDLEYAEEIAAIRTCFVGTRSAVSPDEFSRRVIYVAQHMTLTIEDGRETIAKRPRLEALLQKALN